MKGLNVRRRSHPKSPGIEDGIKKGSIVPIISNEAIHEHLFGSHTIVAEEYAKYTEFNLDTPDDLPRIARNYKLKRQREQLQDGEGGSIDFTYNDLRVDFCEFMKSLTHAHAQEAGVHRSLLDDADAQFEEKTVTEFASLLGYPELDNTANDPLMVLAALPFPVFLTTSPLMVIEAALEEVGKQPSSTMVRWRQDLRQMEERPGDEHEPDSQHPLVCHLFGLDDISSSLVLTEDDYLEFLVDVNQDRDNNTRDGVPAQIRKALSRDVLLLGFSVNSWAFRALYRGLLTTTYNHDGRRGIYVQLPDNDMEHRYVQHYLREAKFNVVWKDLREYAQDLRRHL